MRLKASWSETAGNNDQDLSLDQFMAFRHPESSHANIISKVEENLGVLGEYFFFFYANFFLCQCDRQGGRISMCWVSRKHRPM